MTPASKFLYVVQYYLFENNEIKYWLNPIEPKISSFCKESKVIRKQRDDLS